MKRNDLLRLLHEQGCVLDYEGASRTIYLNPVNGHKVSVGRHQEFDNKLCRKVCKQLGIPIIQRIESEPTVRTFIFAA